MNQYVVNSELPFVVVEFESNPQIQPKVEDSA